MDKKDDKFNYYFLKTVMGITSLIIAITARNNVGWCITWAFLSGLYLAPLIGIIAESIVKKIDKQDEL